MIAGGGAVAGIGFTVSLLIATSPSTAGELEEAKLGVLARRSSRPSWQLARLPS